MYTVFRGNWSVVLEHIRPLAYRHDTVNIIFTTKNKLRGFGPRGNYADRAPLVGEVVRIEGVCCMVGATDSHGRYFFFQVAPQLSSRG
jgi:hypothetical protein